ncbi:MAG: glycosyltransferase family 4 protein [Alphaproteobacteria bacterium]|nr:glycosyltransferase family 4 protein [Alphaproteobacteria bacterium]
MRGHPEGRPPRGSPVVLQVLPALETGGVERGTVEIAQAIVRAGGTALVASQGGRLVGGVERAGGRHIRLRLNSKDPWVIWRNAAALAEIIRRERVEIVHARSRAPAWSALLASRRTGAHFVTTYHALYGEDLPLKRRYNAVMARGERVIAISHYVAEQLLARHRIDPGRVRVIPRGVDPAAFDPDAIEPNRIARIMDTWRLPEGARTVVLAARLTPWKGQSVLIDAIARLRRPDLCAVLIGSDRGHPRYAVALVRQAERLGVIGQLRLVGECDDMPAALLLGDVAVSASTRPEGFGRAVIEAQAMRRPVIATDHGGAVETVEHGVTGWRVPPGDAEALAAAIAHAFALPEAERAQVGARARASVQRSYTTSAMQKATLEVYAELLGR